MRVVAALAIAASLLLCVAHALAEPACSDRAWKQRLDRGRRLASQKRWPSAVEVLSALETECFPSKSAERNLWLLSELAAAQLRAGDKQGCLDTLAEFEEAWVPRAVLAARAMLHTAKQCLEWKESSCDYYTDQNVVCSLALELELAPRARYAAAKTTRCPFKTKVRGAIALPGVADRCVAIQHGRGAKLEELDGDGNAPAGACPNLVLLDGHGVVGKRDPQPETFLDAVSDCCHATVLRTLRDGDRTLVILTSDGPARDCFGGTASVDEWEVFRVEGDRLIPHESLRVLMH